MAASELISETDFAEASGLKKFRLSSLAPVLMDVLKLNKINKLYADHASFNGSEFADRILAGIGVEYEYIKEELKNIPENEPFIAIANHPYGGIDGLILLSVLSKVRPDARIMANQLLQQIKPLSDYFVSVDPFSPGEGSEVNIKGIKRCLRLINDGHPIAIFPAGEVSSLKLNRLRISDKMWDPVVGKLIMKSNVRVVPFYFQGHNSLLFNLLGLVHPNLRTMRLPSELLNKSKEKVQLRIGKPISLKTIEEFDDPNDLLRFIRAKTYALGSSLDVQPYFKRKLFSVSHVPEPIINETPVADLLADVERIRDKSLLFRHDNFEVYISGARFIPNILREISRLREITFREAGEGTNHSADTDEYDLHYKHLFIWDSSANKIVGAYRVGLGDVLYRRYRKKGFYLNDLFKINADFTPVLKSSLELGRSFIVKEYQRKPYSLMLLWKGVNEFLKKENYRYQYLIGPVSISNSFSDLSKDLLVDFIRKNHFDEKLAASVKPRKRFKYQHKGEGKELMKMKLDDIRLLDGLISEIEKTHMKIPVLLKKYLKQNARIIAFNIDPKFNNALDGFLVMDLKNVPGETFELVS